MFKSMEKKLRRKTYEREENERLMIKQNQAQQREISKLRREAAAREDQERAAAYKKMMEKETARLEREREIEMENLELQRRQREEAKRQQALAIHRRQEEDRRRVEELKKQERRQKRQARLGASTPEAIRDLRYQIKERYRLDCLIWGLRSAKSADRPTGEGYMERADAILDEIEQRVDSWEEQDWTPDEWKKAKLIRERVKKGGKRRWKNNPPWSELVERAEWEM